MSTLRPYRILFTTFDGGGNVAPIMDVAERLLARGHDVRVMSDAVNRDEVDAVGARFRPWTRAPNKAVRDRDLDPRDWAAVTPEQALSEMVQYFMCGLALAYAEDVMAELEREPADLVINFDMLLGVMAGCEARGQRLALLSTMVSMFPLPGVPPFGAGLVPARSERDRAAHAEVARAMQNVFDSGLVPLNEARAKLGLGPLAHVLDQANAASVRWLGTARAFDFAPEVLPPYVRYVGPLVRDPARALQWSPPWPTDDRRPLVVVGFSTSFQNHAACVQHVIDACADLPVRVLVSLAGSLRGEELRASSNAWIVDFAPHNAVMRGAAVVVTHGGHGTVMAALTHQVPLLVIAHGRDQGDNAARVVHRGAGLSLAPAASVDELRAALHRLLEEPAFAASARALGEAIAREVRESRLIEEIEALAGEGRERSGATPDLSRRASVTAMLATGVCALTVMRPRMSPAAAPRSDLDWKALQSSIGGELVTSDSAAFASARNALTWNGRKSSRTPDAIVRVRSVDDVRAAVRFASARGLKVAVRSGGHNYHGAPVRDGGLVLDLSALDEVVVNVAKRRARIGPAVKSGALVALLTPLGLAFPVGHCADVTLGGFLLNGGLGWNSGAWGPSCLSVRGMDIVTASGELVHADETHNQELFWAARGAGPGFFGVVTSYELALQKLPIIATSSVVLDAGSMAEAGAWIDQLARSAPPGVEIVCVLGINDPQPKPDTPRSLLVAAFAFGDSEDQARQWLAPFASPPRAAKVLARSDVATTDLAQLQRMNDESFPAGLRFYADQVWSNATPQEVLAKAHKIAFAAPASRSFAFFSPNEVRVELARSEEQAAFSMAGSIYFGAYGFWTETADDRPNLAWVRSTLDSLGPVTVGQYVGEADLAAGPNRVARCFSPTAFRKLTALRQKHDPAGVFHSYLNRS
jgi:MGT family glycosyltransferase